MIRRLAASKQLQNHTYDCLIILEHYSLNFVKDDQVTFSICHVVLPSRSKNLKPAMQHM